MSRKRVGVIGSGIVGQTLAAGFVKHGFETMIGSRDAAKLKGWAATAGVKTGTSGEAAAFGELVVMAVKGTAALDAVKLVGSSSLAGKTVIDTTNPIADAPPTNGVLKFFTSLDESVMERLQKAAPEARFVKAFSSVGNSMMVNPELPGGPPTMFICGNVTNAKAEVADILGTFGWEVADMGTAEAARAIEPLCMLWCIPGFLHNDWTHAFKLLKR
jgi:8-hydroxy-5-deazaflavin:NADPH oxidoreductase